MNFQDTPIDTVKYYWNSRPCNIRHSPHTVGTKEWSDGVEQRKYFVEPHIPAFADFSRWNGKKVLEIGCGLGTDTLNFARLGARVTAVDLSSYSLELAQKRMDLNGLKATFYQANSEELTSVVPIEEYDLVYSFGVIHHTPHPWRVIQQIKKYMGPKSTFKMMVYNKYSWKSLWVLAKYGHMRFWALDELMARYSEAQVGCPVTYLYTKSSIKELLDGFEIDNLFVDHVFPYDIKSYKNYEYKRVWYFRMPRRLFRSFEMTLGWHLCATAHLKSS